METTPTAGPERRPDTTFTFALQRLAFEIMRTGAATVPLAALKGSSEHEASDRPQASRLDAHGWVLVPARLSEDPDQDGPVPGYAFTASGKLVPFLPAETHDCLVVVGNPIDPANIDELWLARQADNLLGYWDQGQGYWNQGRQVPGYIEHPDYLTWGFDYRSAV